MQAVTLQHSDLRFHADYSEPAVRPGEVIVDVIQAGICETDLQLRQGYMGFAGILGHEFVGIARSGTHAGKRVVGEINCNCRQCEMCRRGLGNHCPFRTVIGIDRHDGAFAQSLAIPEANLHCVPDSVTNDEAVFTEPLAGEMICAMTRSRVVFPAPFRPMIPMDSLSPTVRETWSMALKDGIFLCAIVR